jgi:hypothetical protein
MPRSRGMRLIPGMCPVGTERPGRAITPVLSCTARGLSCRDDRSPRGGLLPRHFNLTRRSGRYIFCDTFRGGGLASVGPALARGVLPRGVRTFLCTGKPHSGRRPPADAKLRHGRPPRNTRLGRPPPPAAASCPDASSRPKLKDCRRKSPRRFPPHAAKTVAGPKTADPPRAPRAGRARTFPAWPPRWPHRPRAG